MIFCCYSSFPLRSICGENISTTSWPTKSVLMQSNNPFSGRKNRAAIWSHFSTDLMATLAAKLLQQRDLVAWTKLMESGKLRGVRREGHRFQLATSTVAKSSPTCASTLHCCWANVTTLTILGQSLSHNIALIGPSRTPERGHHLKNSFPSRLTGFPPVQWATVQTKDDVY